MRTIIICFAGLLIVPVAILALATTIGPELSQTLRAVIFGGLALTAGFCMFIGRRAARTADATTLDYVAARVLPVVAWCLAGIGVLATLFAFLEGSTSTLLLAVGLGLIPFLILAVWVHKNRRVPQSGPDAG